MPNVVNKSARIYHFDGGMCGPGQTVELTDEEFEKPAIQFALASGEVVEERDVKRLQDAEQKAAQAGQKAQADQQKAQGDVQQARESAAQKHQQR